jgi:hypothetical protein
MTDLQSHVVDDQIPSPIAVEIDDDARDTVAIDVEHRRGHVLFGGVLLEGTGRLRLDGDPVITFTKRVASV